MKVRDALRDEGRPFTVEEIRRVLPDSSDEDVRKLIEQIERDVVDCSNPDSCGHGSTRVDHAEYWITEGHF